MGTIAWCRQRLLAAAVLTTTAAVTVGCGGPAPGGGDREAGATLRLLTPIFEGADGQKVLEAQLKTFKEKNPKVDVQVDYTSYSKLNEKITTSLASGQPNDVMLM